MAVAAGANHLITGYYDRDGAGVRFTAIDRDLATGRTARRIEAAADDPTHAIAALSHQLAPAAKPLLSLNGEALRNYSSALESDLNSADESLARAVALDPTFGPAWVALYRSKTLKGDKEGANTVLVNARGRRLDPFSEALLTLEIAQTSGNPRVVVAAQERVLSFTPDDPTLLRVAANGQSGAGDFMAAGRHWLHLAMKFPGDPTYWNSLAYARAWAGDYKGAMEALALYAKASPNEPNVLDSTGEVNYLYSRWGDASTAWLNAFAKDGTFLRGGDLYKAAWAKYRGGDKAGADREFQRFKSARLDAKDAKEVLFPLKEADWLYRTGRRAEGQQLLRTAVTAGGVDAALRAEGFSQLAVWDLIEGNRSQAATDAVAAGNPTSVPMALVRFAAEPSTTASQWQVRADQFVRGNGMAAAVRKSALAWALLLDGHRNEAEAAWSDLVADLPATDFFSHAVLTRLEHKTPPPLVPQPDSVNPFEAMADELPAR